jgi:alkylation response protein AidB-like acyl-CoA dehydrogenase
VLFACCGGQPTAFLIERSAPGLSIRPLRGMLGTRASMLAELRLESCAVPREAVLGGVGFGFAAVATSALDIGRLSVASGCVGIIQACLDACLAHASQRSQFGVKLKDHQLIAQMVTDMVTNGRAARLLVADAAALKEAGDPQASTALLVAKYFASTMAARAASDAVQIHGARGCGPGAAVQRYYRDAKVMEIIEGSSQIQQITIAKHAFEAHETGRALLNASRAAV